MILIPTAHYNRIVKDELKILSNGDLTVICQTYITLTATVIGDTSNHTFLWEQTSGAPVSWIDALDSFEVTYSQNVGGDKTFRFWVDKGKKKQKFIDITVFSTPTEKYDLQMGSGSNTETIGYFPEHQVQATSTSNVFIPALPSINDTQTSVNGNQYYLKWDHPSNTAYLVAYSVEESIDGDFVTVATNVTMGGTLYSTINPDASYRIKYVYRMPNRSIFVTYSEVKRVEPLLQTVIAAAERYGLESLQGSSNADFSATYIRRSLLVLDETTNPPIVPESYELQMGANANVDYSTTYIKRSLLILNEPGWIGEVLEESILLTGASSNSDFSATYITIGHSTIG